MQEHELKTWPEYFQKVWTGEKNFEVRKLDRFFNVGDTLVLKEWSPVRWQDKGGYSGREISKKVSYLMNGGKWDIPEGVCIMGIVDGSTPTSQVRHSTSTEILSMLEDEEIEQDERLKKSGLQKAPAPEITVERLHEIFSKASLESDSFTAIDQGIKAIHSAIAEQMDNGWTDELVLKFAELYRWSSGRFSVKTFLQDKAWHNIEVKELGGNTIPDILKEKDNQLAAKEKEVERLKTMIDTAFIKGRYSATTKTLSEVLNNFKQQHNL